MPRVTVNRILELFCTKHELKRAYIDMVKFEGTYHLSGKFAALMSECEINTHIQRLSDWTIDRWVEHLSSIVKKEGWQSTNLNMLIEKVNCSDT